MLSVRWLPVFLLALVVLMPYHQLIVGRAIPIPDDIGASDLADGEFPQRVEAGRLVRAGEWPLWTPRVLTGFPLVVDPLSLAFFVTLPPALALDWLIALLLVIAAGGTYVLARRLGATRSGAFLAGFAYSWSGCLVCQLRHLGVLRTIAFFPLALFCLEMAATGGASDRAAGQAFSLRRRLGWLVGFAAVFGLQALAGYPQSALISGLVYTTLVAARTKWLLGRGQRTIPGRSRFGPAAGFASGAVVAATLGAAVGMTALLPLQELGALSDRGGGGTFEWATQYNYAPRNFLTFFAPYINGDISNLTYTGGSIFWEDYGYVGLATIILAGLVMAVRAKRFVRGHSADPKVEAHPEHNAFVVAFWGWAALLAYGLVLGKALPLYRLAHQFVPGLSLFRFPTRFLFVVELALVLLGGLGLTLVQKFIARDVASGRLRDLPRLVGVAVVGLTVVDLVYYNSRQNPIADAERWLAPPATASIIRASGEGGRVFTPASQRQHVAVFMESRGWSGDLRRYYAHRELLQPNSNLLHGIATLDGYTAISPRWTVDLIGDHNRRGLLGELYGLDSTMFRPTPAFFDWLEALSVRWLILSGPASSDRIQQVGTSQSPAVYCLPRALPRARIVPRARFVPSMDEVRRLTWAGQLDLRHEVLLHDPAAARLVASLDGNDREEGPGGETRIIVDRATEVVIEAQAPRGGLLLLADTFYPGWEATVDGKQTPILRANVVHRAVSLSPGTHRVEFVYRPQSVTRGLVLTATGIAVLLVGAALLFRRRAV